MQAILAGFIGLRPPPASSPCYLRQSQRYSRTVGPGIAVSWQWFRSRSHFPSRGTIALLALYLSKDTLLNIPKYYLPLRLLSAIRQQLFLFLLLDLIGLFSSVGLRTGKGLVHLLFFFFVTHTVFILIGRSTILDVGEELLLLLLGKVGLVAEHDEWEPFGVIDLGLLQKLVPPGVKHLERLKNCDLEQDFYLDVRHVKHKHAAICVSEEQHREAHESFLPSCVPELPKP